MTLCLFGSNRERQKGKVERTKKKHGKGRDLNLA